ncbi:MAG TPA: hypothetical protein VG184_07265 [Acidimicrobiales bacterium]|nr:hypothetical protein [Acidimicrobiales bacterium]
MARAGRFGKDWTAVALPHQPPPVDLGSGRLAVPVDVESVDATLVFDVAARQGRGSAKVVFVVDDPGGCPVLDLRQEPAALRLDGAQLGGHAFPRCDLGAGLDAGMRVLDASVGPGRHTLELDYPLATPAAARAEPVAWCDAGVRFDLWMSDLAAGRYLEMWVPANLCHDRFALSVEVVVTGAARPHVAVANGDVADLGAGTRFRVVYPDRYTSLSPMLVVAPADEVELRRRPVALAGRGAPIGLVVARHREVDADLAACEADIAGWLTYLAERYGPWVHGEEFCAFVWGPGRGMEYDGATTASVPALEHEVFHTWFGRGVKPATAGDGWIDEAFTTWATSSRRAEGARFADDELGLDTEPVTLRPPHPWSRHTPVESYASGARLFAGLAVVVGGPGRLRSAMADWYRANAGGLVSTDGLEAHLTGWSGVDVGPWFARYVHGRG